ncbi:MAG: 4Fe-4S cluster-binding domain-containing protein [Candidatus Aminicenantes bacterium]|jgi:uncharacterized Fe-S cluster-containing radical SAM superfamily protein
MKMHFPFDPIERSREVERVVMKEGKRLYHRFRAAPYYGGIATADAIGCSFLCAYCWNYFRNLNPARFDKHYSPSQVAFNLLRIARKKSFHLFRITGSEPVLGEPSLNHLVEVLKIIFSEMEDSTFILETNGFFLGYRTDLVEKINFRNLWIRISLKGVDEESFETIAGVSGEFFTYPLIALKKMEDQGLKAWPAVMRDLFADDELTCLSQRLAEMEIKARLEEEVLEAYPFVLENMEKRGIEIKHPH